MFLDLEQVIQKNMKGRTKNVLRHFSSDLRLNHRDLKESSTRLSSKVKNEFNLT